MWCTCYNCFCYKVEHWYKSVTNFLLCNSKYKTFIYCFLVDQLTYTFHSAIAEKYKWYLKCNVNEEGKVFTVSELQRTWLNPDSLFFNLRTKLLESGKFRHFSSSVSTFWLYKKAVFSDYVFSWYDLASYHSTCVQSYFKTIHLIHDVLLSS